MTSEESGLRCKGSGSGVRLPGSGSGLCDPGQVDETLGSPGFFHCKMGYNCSSSLLGLQERLNNNLSQAFSTMAGI